MREISEADRRKAGTGTLNWAILHSKVKEIA